MFDWLSQLSQTTDKTNNNKNKQTNKQNSQDTKVLTSEIISTRNIETLSKYLINVWRYQEILY